MPRFFIDETPQGDTVALHGENAHHAGRVLRLRPGEALTLCDGWASPGYVSPERLLYGGSSYLCGCL